MKDFFDAKVIKVVPAATRNDVIYTQDVLIELKDGERIYLFDGSCMIEKELQGQMIKVFANVTQGILPQKIKGKEKQVKQKLVKGQILHLNSVTQYKPKEMKWIEGLIDCGVAIFSVNMEYNTKIKEGDFVKFDSKNIRFAIINRTW